MLSNAMAQVLHTLHVAEACRIGDKRNILQVRTGLPLLLACSMPAGCLQASSNLPAGCQQL